MRTTTLKFTISGDSYEDLTYKADAAITKFLQSEHDEDIDFDDEDDIEPIKNQNVNYELIVSESTVMSSEYEYSAEVIARIKDVRS